MLFLRTESYKKGIIFSTALNILAKGIAFLNTLIIAYYFGANAVTDIYFGVISVALIITNTVNGIDFLVLIPESMRLREQADEQASQKFVNFFLYSYAVIGIFITAVIIVSPTFFYSFFTSFDSDLLLQHKRVLYLSSIIIFFQIINNLLNAVLTAYKFFTISILTGLVNSVLAIALTVIFHRQLGIEGTIIGLCIGFFINFVLLIVVLIRFQRWNFLQVGWVTDKNLWINILLMQVNILPVWFRNYITLFLLSGLGSGVITSLNLGQMIAAVPEVFILSQVASVVGIKFSELSAVKDIATTKSLLHNVFTLLLMLILPLSIVMTICHGEIVELLFFMRKFEDKSFELISLSLFYFSILLPSKVFDIVFTRLFTSFQIYKTSIFFAFVGHLLITVLSYFLIVNFGLSGHFWALLIGYYIVMPFVFFAVIWYKFTELKTLKFIQNFAVFFLISIFVFAVGQLTWLASNTYYPVKIIIVSIVVFILFYVCSYLTIDLTYFVQLMKSLTYKLRSNKI